MCRICLVENIVTDHFDSTCRIQFVLSNYTEISNANSPFREVAVLSTGIHFLGRGTGGAAITTMNKFSTEIGFGRTWHAVA